MSTGLVVADGMLTWREWIDADKAAWLAKLDMMQVRAQASVIAVAHRLPVATVLGWWICEGYLGQEWVAQAAPQ